MQFKLDVTTKSLLLANILSCCMRPHSRDTGSYGTSAAHVHLATICWLRQGAQISVCALGGADVEILFSKYSWCEVRKPMRDTTKSHDEQRINDKNVSESLCLQLSV